MDKFLDYMDKRPLLYAPLALVIYWVAALGQFGIYKLIWGILK